MKKARELTEEEVCKKLTSGQQIALNVLDFVMWDWFDVSRYTQHDGILINFNVSREDLNLEPGKLPGDIDLLVIPYKDDLPLFLKSTAIEVKIIRPTLSNPSRNANKMGGSQTLGIISDGFPFVGLLHVCIPEVSPKDSLIPVPFVDITSERFIKTGEFQMTDYFVLNSAERQFGRMEKLGLPDFVGLHAFGLWCDSDEIQVEGWTFHRHHASYNPFISHETVQKIKHHWETKIETYTKIEWNFKNAP